MLATLVATAVAPATFAASITTLTYGPSGSVAGSTVGASTLATFAPVTAITAGSTITLTFPAGTTLSGLTTASFTIAQAASGRGTAGTATAPSAVQTPTSTTVTLTVAPASLSTVTNAGLGTVTIAYTAAGSSSIINPSVATTTGAFTVATSVGDTGTLNNVVFLALGAGSSLSATPPTATADGVSLVNITVTTAALMGTSDVVELTTTLGTFSAVSATDTVWATPTVSATSVYGTAKGTSGSTVVTLVAPSVAGTAIVRLYDTVDGVGAPILIGTTTVAYSASTAASYMAVGAPSLSSISSALGSGPSVITATVTNSTNGPMANQIVTITSTLGYLGTNGAGYCTSSPGSPVGSNGAGSCIEVSNTLGQVTAWLFGGGVAGTSTVTFTSGTLTGSTTVTIGGSFSKLAVSQLVSAGAEGTAYTTATNPILFVTPEDASGNPIQLVAGTGDLSFTLTNSIFASTPTWGAYTTGTTISGTTYVGYPLYGTCGPNSGSTKIAISATNEYVVPNTTINAAPVTFSCAGSAASFTLTPSATSVAPGGTVTLTVAAKDASGNPAPDGTTVSVFSNGVGNVVSTSGATSGVTTSGGSATFYFLAPSTAGTASVTAFVGGITAPQSVSITVGAVAPPVTSSATAGTVLGLGMSGFSATTKVAKYGQYVTWQFGFGSAAAGKNVTILWEAKSASGTWPGMKAFTGRIADANGNVTFHWKFSSAKWISVEAQLGTVTTPARQARWM
jgi:hypothetical protein